MSPPTTAAWTAVAAALMLGIGCADPLDPDTGIVLVTVLTDGADPDVDGYKVRIGPGFERRVGINETVRFTDVPPGTYSVQLVSIAPNCTVVSELPDSVMVQAGRTVTVSLMVVCRSLHGSAWVTATTSGVEADTDGYSVVVGHFFSQHQNAQYAIASNGAVLLPRVPVGRHRLTLAGVLPNCDSPAGLSRELTISSSDTSAVVFDVVCAPAGPLAFVRSDNTGQEDVAIIRSNGAGFRLLTDHPAWDGDPAWSPGGNRIAFATDRDGNREIYVVEQDGSNLVRLTDDPALDHSPSWSPEGGRIAFVRTRAEDGAQGGIWIMNADGTDPVQLTGQIQDDLSDTDPVWSPDGRTIAFTRRQGDDDARVFVMDADGSDVRSLSSGNGAHPAWSPDGTQVAYTARACFYVDYACYDGLVVRNLGDGVAAHLPVVGREPAWSTDGRHIAYTALSCDFYYSDCVPAGIEIIRLINNSTFELRNSGRAPTWR